MLTFLRELDGALDDEELAEEGLFPSTESSSSKFLSEKEAQTPLFKNTMFSLDGGTHAFKLRIQ